MRHRATAPDSPAPTAAAPPGAQALPPRSDWDTLARLFPYLWEYKWRVMAALAFMISAKVANVGVPVLLKTLVDTMSPAGGNGAPALLVVPLALLVAYGLLRLSTSLFTELLDNALKNLNSDYEAKRYSDMLLKPPIIVEAQRGTFFNWLKSKNKLGGQFKVPRLSNERTIINEILAQMNNNE